MKRLILLSRPGCERCEHLEDALHAAFGGRYRLDWRDVDREPAWRPRFGTRIPVLLADDGALLCAGTLDADAVADYLCRADSSV